MKSNSFFKKVVCTLLTLLISAVALAQTNGDKLFGEGQLLQKRQSVSSQTLAIKKFQAAKIAYTTADKKTMCDNQIDICNNNIRSIRKIGKTAKVVAAPVLTLGKTVVEFEGESNGVINIPVKASTKDWSFSVAEGIEGEQAFVHVTCTPDSTSLDIAADPNLTTLARHQSVEVACGDSTQILMVKQTGKKVTLSTGKNLVEFALKGGSKSLEIYCNSDSIVADNNEHNWYVESKPEWIEVTAEVKKNKSLLNKGLAAIKGVVSNTAAATNAEDVKESAAKLTAEPLVPGDESYAKGRKGEIIFASQDRRYKVIVTQHK